MVVTAALPGRHLMLSRYDRDSLVEVIERYLSDGLTAFQLDEALSDIAAKTKDKTARQVADLFWHHYDDVQDHQVVASKNEWDYFQRLLLILKSEAEIVMEPGELRWTVRQAVAAVCLALFGLAVARTGFGFHLLLTTIPLGIVSMLLAHWRSRVESKRLHEQTALTPFGSVSELLSLRRKLTHFVKARYPARLGSRQIRSPLSAGLMWLHSGVGWLICSPVALACQMMPEPEHRWKVVSP